MCLGASLAKNVDLKIWKVCVDNLVIGYSCTHCEKNMEGVVEKRCIVYSKTKGAANQRNIVVGDDDHRGLDRRMGDHSDIRPDVD